jgi:hypothetical protein
MGEGRSRLGVRSLSCSLGALALIALLTLVPAATADLSFCPPGSGSGQCEKQQGVALDTETGHLYVADKGNKRIDVFKEDGEFLFSFGEGELSGPVAVAVDNGAASLSHHDVYVADVTDPEPPALPIHRVIKFDASGAKLLAFGKQGPGPGEFEEIKGIGVTAAGLVYVADTKIEGDCKGGGFGENELRKRAQKFNDKGELTGAAEPTDAPCGAVSGFAVDPGGDFYLSNAGASNAIRKYGPGAEPICEVDKAVETTALAVDPAGRLLSAQGETRVRGAGAGFRPITQYDSGCQHLRRFGYGAVERRVLGLAVPEASPEGVFASEAEQGIHFIEQPPPGPIIAAAEAGPIGNTKATLAAEINPEGKATKYHFEYVDQASFEASGFSGAAKTAEEELAVPGGTEFKLHVAEALAGCPNPVKEASEEGKCLLPETTFRFRVVVKNADGEGNSPLEGEAFTTKPRVELGDIWSSAVGVDTARLHGEVNPLGIPTTGYFEYVDDASFQESGFNKAIKAPAVGEGEAPIDFGTSESFTARATQLDPLLPATTYHYRLVVEGPLLKEAVISPERAFKTFATKAAEGPCAANEDFRTGPSALLPDCRAYEMVSPLDKEGGDIVVLEASTSSFGPAVLNQSAVSGSKLAYGSLRAFGDVKAAFLTSQYIAARGPGGWASHAISPPHEALLYEAVADLADTELKAFSPDLCEAWLRTVSDPLLAPGAVEGYPNLYRSHDKECGGPSYEALTTVKPPHIASGELPGYLLLELQGASEDGSHAIYIAPDNLPGTGAPDLGGGDNASQLYVWAGGPAPVFVCYLPGGQAWEKPCVGGGTSRGGGTVGRNRSANEQGAISADGQGVFWTAFTSGESGPGQIYLREHPEQGQVAGECGEAAKACTIAVSEEAEELSGTGKEGSRFLAAASDGSKAIFATGEDLYEFDLGSETTTLIAHHALSSGILGASEDASHVYFVSTDALGGENGDGASAQPGEPNLYLWKEGTIAFIVTLSEEDASRLFGSPIDLEPRFHLARVSPDGLHAAFMSNSRALSEETAGYDNTDANSGEADTEVFLYAASAGGGAGKLICASCNPSGARPAGTNTSAFGAFWAAAQIPASESTLYAPRVLSDDGTRLFFESSDALVSRDTNGKRDVYEWEALGTGGCEEKDVSFSARAEGCIDLISSGQSPRDSEFVDASPSGKDAFFTTLSSLLPQDYGLVDVYDARVGGGYPPPPPRKVECEGGACQSPPPPPQAPTPASSALGGSRQALPNEKHCGKGKRRVVRKGKARCVAQHKRNRRGQGGPKEN